MHTLARSIEMQEFDSQQVVWEQSQGALNATAEITDGAEQDAASMLHVVLRGKVWVFKKDGSASSKNKDTKTVKDLWASPLQMYARFGHCQQTLVECDCMGEPTALTHEYSMIADKGTGRNSLKSAL